ncbi:MAG: hypothetical protein FWF10_05780 [Clostridiales bacterium]|nr:hypothetical protein [Clostridiales bacterium]
MLRCFLLVLPCLIIGSLLLGCRDEGKTTAPSAEIPAFEYTTINIENDFYTPHSGYFRGYITPLGNITLGIEGAVYNEESARLLFRALEADYTTLQAFLTDSLPLREITIFVEAESINGAYVKGTHIYFSHVSCSLEELQYALVQAATALEPWQCYAIQAMVYGDMGSLTGSNAALLSHYNTAENLHMCSMFAGYFAENFNTEEELDLAIQSAKSLAAYIVAGDGLPAFLSAADPLPYVHGWLQSMGGGA